MIHLRIDNEREKSKRRFACGIGPELPAGDKYVFDGEIGFGHMVDCPGCCGNSRLLGIPASELSGRPGHPGFQRFVDVAKSWGFD